MSLKSRIQSTTPETQGPVGPAVTVREEPEATVVTDPFAELKTRVHHEVITRLGPRLFAGAESEKTGELADRVRESVEEAIALDKTPLTRQERARIALEITDDILGYGPLEPFLRDETVTEIMVNGSRRIYIERRGKLTRTNAQFVDDQHLLRIIDKIISRIGRRVDEGSPMVDARLPDGSRVNAIIPPLAVSGPTLTIRKFRKDPFTMEDLLRFGTLTPKAGQFLEACVRGKLNILISGGTGSGKTTTLNVMSAAIPNDERIITVEDAAELQLRQDHVITLETRPANIEGKGAVLIRDLVRNTLRMRPDRIIVGECRGAETVDMLQAMNTGHDGSLTTIHANTPRDALSRVETLVLTAGVELPLKAIREQIASAFDLVVQVSRLVDGTRRVTHVTEVLKMESDVVTLQDLFIAKPVEDTSEAAENGSRLLGPMVCSGIQPQFLNKLSGNGVQLPAQFFLTEPPKGAQGGAQPASGGYGAFGRRS
jgi:pilus assembly protein CpaF